ncbi:MAG: glycosyltransferase, partial [Dysgonamonadaceae bacterium]|nr:glycosyltransferase [Dysgonamonadaceae bacterium]
MNEHGKISVLIPTYNCANYIAEAIDSVLAQNYDNIEIIVVDDGSTDGTADVIENLLGFQNLTGLNTIKYFRQPHSGISAARNFALSKATGELIAWLDADDRWSAGKLAAQLNYLEENPDCKMSFPDINEVEKTIVAFSELGCRISITEMDMSVLPVFNPF